MTRSMQQVKPIYDNYGLFYLYFGSEIAACSIPRVARELCLGYNTLQSRESREARAYYLWFCQVEDPSHDGPTMMMMSVYT